MQSDYKPTLRFSFSESKRISAIADEAGLTPAGWMRKLILDNAPQLEISNPLAVRVDEFDPKLGWNLISLNDAIAFAKTVQQGSVEELEQYLVRYTKQVDNGELWIDCEAIPGVPSGDVTSIRAQAVDLCREILRAHIRSELAQETKRPELKQYVKILNNDQGKWFWLIEWILNDGTRYEYEEIELGELANMDAAIAEAIKMGKLKIGEQIQVVLHPDPMGIVVKVKQPE